MSEENKQGALEFLQGPASLIEASLLNLLEGIPPSVG